MEWIVSTTGSPRAAKGSDRHRIAVAARLALNDKVGDFKGDVEIRSAREAFSSSHPRES